MNKRLECLFFVCRCSRPVERRLWRVLQRQRLELQQQQHLADRRIRCAVIIIFVVVSRCTETKTVKDRQSIQEEFHPSFWWMVQLLIRLWDLCATSSTLHSGRNRKRQWLPDWLSDRRLPPWTRASGANIRRLCRRGSFTDAVPVRPLSSRRFAAVPVPPNHRRLQQHRRQILPQWWLRLNTWTTCR